MPDSADDAPPVADDDHHKLLGKTIGGRYRIDAPLGEGAMGAVYRGTQLGLRRSVAIKILHPRHTDEPMVAKRFDREAVAVSKLDHRNCVQVLDAGTTDDRLKYIVMEHLDGHELRDLLSGPLEVARAVDLAAQILRGLEHAHRRGLVHRDLKPENVFVVRDDDGEEVVKLVDFGIVKLLDPGTEQERLTRAGMVFGTPAYMSPEQAVGGKVDERTDLYASGILLYEMLSGAPPFEADEPGIMLRMQLVADPPPLPETVPEPVREVVGTLLAKGAADRYASAREAREALESAASTQGPWQRRGVMFMRAPSEAEAEAEAATTETGPEPVGKTLVGAEPFDGPELEPAPSPAASASASSSTIFAEHTPRPPSSGPSDVDPPSAFGVQLPPSGVFGTARALPNVDAVRPGTSARGKAIAIGVLVLTAGVVALFLAASGVFDG